MKNEIEKSLDFLNRYEVKGFRAPKMNIPWTEIEVLRFAAGAMSNYEIAKTLVIEESTVKSHMNHILGKLQAKNRLQRDPKPVGFLRKTYRWSLKK